MIMFVHVFLYLWEFERIKQVKNIFLLHSYCHAIKAAEIFGSGATESIPARVIIWCYYIFDSCRGDIFIFLFHNLSYYVFVLSADASTDTR